MNLTGDEHFIDFIAENHGVTITQDDLRCLRAHEAEMYQAAALARYEATGSAALPVELDAGANPGKFLTSILAAGVAAATGQWWAFGAALLSGALSLLEKPKERDIEEKVDERGGFEQSGQLAPAGGTVPMIYCRRSAENPAGGVRVGGILIHVRVEIRAGTSYLYQLYLISAGQSPTLGYGQLGAIDASATLINQQPLSNFNSREVQTWTRLGLQNQSAIPQFPYYCQNVSPPDNNGFGCNRIAKLGDIGPADNPNPSLVGAVYYSPTVVGRTASGSGWNAGVFSDTGLAGAGIFSFERPIGVAGVGLSGTDQDQNWTSIRSGFLFDLDGSAVVVESGVGRIAPFAAPVGEIYEIEYTLSQIIYRVGGRLLYISAIAPSFPAFPDIGLFSAGSSVSGLSIGSAGSISTNGSLGSTIVPTSNQADSSTDNNALSLFDSALDYVVQISGETSRDPQFHVITKSLATKTFTTDPVVNAPIGSQIYSFSRAIYESTRPADRLDFNLQFALSASHSGKAADKNNGKTVTFANLFDVWIKKASDPVGSETRVIRLLAKNRNRGRMNRAFRLVNLAYGRYTVELRPLNKVPTDIPLPIYELTDYGYGTDPLLDLEDLPLVPTGIFIAGSEVRVQGELELVTNGVLNAGTLYGSQIQLLPDGTQISANLDGQTATRSTPSAGGEQFTITIGGYIAVGEVAAYGLTSTAVIEHGWEIKRTNQGFTARSIIAGILGFPVSVGVGSRLSYYVNGASAVITLNGTTIATTPLTIANAVMFPAVRLDDSGLFPAPVSNIVVAVAAGQYTVEQIDEWMNYDNKTQVSTEQGASGRITSVNEITHPASIGNPANGLPNPYPGYALQAHRFISSDRIRQAPGTRTLITEGHVCPNWVAGGISRIGSSATPALVATNEYTSLTDFTANFPALGVLPGQIVRNLDTGTEAAIVAVTQSTITTRAPLPWSGASWGADRYAIYFLASTCYVPDVFADLVRRDFGGIPHLIDPDEFLHYPSIASSRAFCVRNKYFFDDVIYQSIPFAQWAAQTLRLSHLYPMIIDGRLGLTPDGPGEVLATFNDGLNARNIVFAYPEGKGNMTNTVILRYVDGRDGFDLPGAKHRQVSIKIETAAAAAGTEPPITEEVDARSVKNPEQAISVGCLYLKSLRAANFTVSLETSWTAAHLRAGNIVSVQSANMNIGDEYSGGIRRTRQATNGDWLVLLDHLPILKDGYTPVAAPNGVYGITLDMSAISPGDLLVNRDTGASGVVTAVDGDSITAPVEFAAGDEYFVVNLTVPTVFDASIKYRETGRNQVIAGVSIEWLENAAWVRLVGCDEPPRQGDPVNIGPTSYRFRITRISNSTRDVFQINGALHDADVFDRSGLVVSIDNEVVVY